MWVFLNNAFLSIVADRSSKDRLLIRARIKGDIEAALKAADIVGIKVHYTPKADYLYRAFVERKLVKVMLEHNLNLVTYDNFKKSVADDDRHNAYLAIWFKLREYQKRQAQITKTRKSAYLNKALKEGRWR